MIKPAFKTGNEHSLMIGEKYLCNGHWLVSREHVNRNAPKALQKLLVMRPGRYYSGSHSEADTDKQCVTVIPKRDGFERVLETPKRAIFKGDAVSVYVFETEGGKEIGVNPNYVPILRMGTCFAKVLDKSSYPVLILNGPTLNDDFVGLVMPMRIAE